MSPSRPLLPSDAKTPWVTYGLIAANTAMFALELISSASVRSPDLHAMVSLGANFGPLTLHGEPWRLVTAMFLHFGVIHIGMNMVCLYQVRIVERMVGRAEFLALYFGAGLVSGLASLVAHADSVSAGASGAVFGMFGAFTAIMLARRAEIDPDAWKRTMRSLGTFFVINLAFGLSQRDIDLSAHAAGLTAGFIGGFALEKTWRPAARPVVRALVVLGVGAATAFGGLCALRR